MRGEHIYRLAPLLAKDGSSPHAWGTRTPLGRWRDRGRFIPTCVGNTHGSRPLCAMRSVHPHMRGEHQKHKLGMTLVDGSSPHAWGTLFAVFVGDQHERFIPTCVGNTNHLRAMSTTHPVHPHM